MLQSEGKVIDRSDPALLEALRERRYFLIAEKYSQSPAICACQACKKEPGQHPSVRDWSDYDFQQAWMNFTAESGDVKMTPDDVKQTREKIQMARPGYVLDLPYEHWKKFIVDGKLDEAKLTAGGYTEGQFDYIQGELNTLGWLGEPEYTTGPLSDTSED